MSHRDFDETARLREQLSVVEADIAELKSKAVVDFFELSDLRKTRAGIMERIEQLEDNLHDA